MRQRIVVMIVILVAGCGLGGCYTKPVRHLAADVALVKVGESTKDDVLVYLGTPDAEQQLGDGRERWLYKETKKELLERTPVVGKYFGTPELRQVTISFSDGVVSDTTFRSEDQDDLDWADDYSWQENRK